MFKLGIFWILLSLLLGDGELDELALLVLLAPPLAVSLDQLAVAVPVPRHVRPLGVRE